MPAGSTSREPCAQWVSSWYSLAAESPAEANIVNAEALHLRRPLRHCPHRGLLVYFSHERRERYYTTPRSPRSRTGRLQPARVDLSRSRILRGRETGHFSHQLAAGLPPERYP